MEAIILAGGRGTRLQAVLPEGLPKPLAPVAGRPFLEWLLDYLRAQGFRRVVLSVGWKADAIVERLGHRHGELELAYCREDTPLGTGGAIRLALRMTSASDVVVLNGDTFLEMSHREMLERHRAERAHLSIACVAVGDAARYGRIVLEGTRVASFQEKGQSGPGLINGGTYVLRRDLLDAAPDGAFSFETDFMMPGVASLRPLAYRAGEAFLDIGVPEDLERAQTWLPGRFG